MNQGYGGHDECIVTALTYRLQHGVKILPSKLSCQNRPASRGREDHVRVCGGGCTDEKPDPQFIKHVLRAGASDLCSLHGDIQGEEKR